MHLPFLLRTYRSKFSKTRIQSIGYKEKVLHLHKLSTFVPYTMRFHKTTIRTPHGEKLLFKLPKNDADHAFLEITHHEDLSAAVIDPDEVTTPHLHDFYQLIWCVEGSGLHFIDFNEYPIVNGRMFFCAPGQCHYSKGIAYPNEYSILFNEALLADLEPHLVHEIKFGFFHRLGRLPYLDIPAESNDRLLDTIRLMQKECSEHATEYRHTSICTHLLSMFFITIRRILPQECFLGPMDQEDCMLITGFIDCVERHYHEIHSLDFYAQQLHCSEAKLRRVMHDQLCTSPLTFINMRRIEEAKRLLHASDAPVKNIATDLGIPHTYFTTFFKKCTGMSPKDYRGAECEDAWVRNICRASHADCLTKKKRQYCHFLFVEQI